MGNSSAQLEITVTVKKQSKSFLKVSMGNSSAQLKITVTVKKQSKS